MSSMIVKLGFPDSKTMFVRPLKKLTSIVSTVFGIVIVFKESKADFI